mgnify:CR=1 FL=1
MMLYKITTEKERAYYQKKLRRLGRWVDRYQKPFWFYSSYPINDRVLDEWWLITQSLRTRT